MQRRTLQSFMTGSSSRLYTTHTTLHKSITNHRSASLICQHIATPLTQVNNNNNIRAQNNNTLSLVSSFGITRYSNNSIRNVVSDDNIILAEDDDGGMYIYVLSITASDSKFYQDSTLTYTLTLFCHCCCACCTLVVTV
jgi:hypothetical protein